MNEISFKSNFIKSVNVRKRNKPETVSLLRLNKSDIYSIERVSEKWDTDISYRIVKSVYIPPKCKAQQIYALSTQKENYSRLNPSKTLALFEVLDEGDNFTLEYLDVNPKYKYNAETGERKMKNGFSGLGKACVEYVKKRFNSKDIFVYPKPDAKLFYAKLGFSPLSKEKDHIYHLKNIIK